MRSLTLNTGATIPELGFGLYLINDEVKCRTAVNTALEAGYRHFDTAQVYRNEGYLGETLAQNHVPRDEVFITTKIHNANQAEDRLESSFEASLRALQTDYVDLLLLHFPVSGVRQAAWGIMAEIYQSGRAKSVGVSNYTIRHLEELFTYSKLVPAVNQVELHVYLQQPELVKYCASHGIVVEAYSPLAHGHDIDHPVLREIAVKHGKTPAQVMIRWCLEVGTVPLPKSQTPARIRENFDVFDFKLDKDDMAKILTLESGRRTAWDPTGVE